VTDESTPEYGEIVHGVPRSIPFISVQELASVS